MIAVEDGALEIGKLVTIIEDEGDESVEVDAETEQLLADRLESARRGNTIDADDVLDA